MDLQVLIFFIKNNRELVKILAQKWMSCKIEY